MMCGFAEQRLMTELHLCVELAWGCLLLICIPGSRRIRDTRGGSLAKQQPLKPPDLKLIPVCVYEEQDFACWRLFDVKTILKKHCEVEFNGFHLKHSV